MEEKMDGFEEKAKELAEHLDLLTCQFVLAQHHSNSNACENLSRQEIKVIDTVGKGKSGSYTMSEIADRVALSMSSVTGIVDKLVAKKLVRREHANDDRRIVRVELTPDGRKMYEKALESRIKVGRYILDSLDETEQETLLGLFRKISRKIMEGIRVNFEGVCKH
jgi:DNA-binding MarR family transcriptional regulator